MLQWNDTTQQWEEDSESTPEAIPSKPPSEVAGTIEGYGTRVISDKGNQGVWTGPGGEVAAPEYVKDVQDTINAVDTGAMSEPALRNKIVNQERIPGKPTDDQLTSYDRWKRMETMAAPDLDAAEKEGRDSYRKNFSGVDELLMNPKETAAFHTAVAQAGKARRDKELTVLKSVFDHQETLRSGKEKEPLVIQALRERLGREPTAQEKQTETESANLRMTKTKAEINADVKNAGGFASWTPEAKAQTFVSNMITGKPPVNAAGLGGNDRKQYGKEYAQWQVDQGVKPQDIALMQADYRAGDMSLKNMKKQEAPMSAFVGNINKQIDKVQELYSKDDRLGLRLIDLPVRELRVRAKGSGDEAVKASYLLEISNEIGKLSSGSSASIQQLSDSAKEDWKKVHDVNLSLGEIMKVVNATRDQANMRMDSWKTAGEEVRNQIRSLGTTGQPPPPGTTIPNKPKFTIIKVR